MRRTLRRGKAPTAEELRDAVDIVVRAALASEDGRDYRDECGPGFAVGRLPSAAAVLATEGLPMRGRWGAAHRAVAAVQRARRLYGEDRS